MQHRESLTRIHSPQLEVKLVKCFQCFTKLPHSLQIPEVFSASRLRQDTLACDFPYNYLRYCSIRLNSRTGIQQRVIVAVFVSWRPEIHVHAFCTFIFVTLSPNDEVAEWLRRWTANPLGSARVGSNPILVGLIFFNSLVL